MDTVWMKLISILLLISCDVIDCARIQERSEEVCSAETFTASCLENHTILIQRAEYGHMRLGRCIDQDSGRFGCQHDVTHILQSHCSGHNQCEMAVPNAELQQTKPCASFLNLYLQVSYTCQPVIVPDVTNCHYLSVYDVTETSGYLASSVTKTSGCGSMLTPWQILAKPGQTINITMLDFSAALNEFYAYHAEPYIPSGPCTNYGTIAEAGSKNPVIICGGQQRESLILSTTSPRVNISIFNDALDNTFLLHFQVSGCADEEDTKITWYKRTSSDTASMGCQVQEIQWTMKCENNVWLGHRGNCSSVYPPENHTNQNHHDISYGLAVAIIIGAALVVCSLIVMIGIIRYRRSSYNDYNATYNTHTSLLRRHHAEREQYEMRCTCPVPPQQHDKAPTHAHVLEPNREHQHAHTATIRRSPHVPRHYSLKKTVEVEGNDYEHIWQTPLPNPRTQQPTNENAAAASQNNNNDKVDSKSYQNNAATPRKNAGSVSLASTTAESLASTSSSRTSSFKGGNVISKETKKPYYVTSNDILLSGSKDKYGSVTASEQETCKNDTDSTTTQTNKNLLV